ncbi:MAG: hypothetical protein KME13_25600 [Myxacorys californica WJT36-NPBG1]|jgi:hypothetical protein|nr:hypothetical protein [Myxacorys californica WJT36-NPBG1]
MTISSRDSAAITAHPIYASVLASLPPERPIPLTQILAEYATHAQQLATVLLVATTFEQVLEGCWVLPCALVCEALSLLSEAEQQRILNLFIHHLEQARAGTAVQALHDLLHDFKVAAWKKLPKETQDRIDDLQRGGRAPQ